MIVTAPDRSIPPYSVMGQVGHVITVNVPPSTTDAQVEALLFRFRVAREEGRDAFRRLKIRPTTPDGAGGQYQRITIYVIGNPGLAEESVLREYVSGEPTAQGAFERAVRGVYRLTPDTEFAAIGYVPERVMPSVQKPQPRILFEERIVH
jgi:hypothetical protein